MKWVIIAAVVALLVGLKMGWIPVGGIMDKMRAPYQLDFKHAVKAGMKEDEVIQAVGGPDQRQSDPYTGNIVWTYREGDETLYVSFRGDKVVGVSTTR